MKINPVIASETVTNNNTVNNRQRNIHSDIGFKSYEPAKAREIAQRLERNYGVKCNFDTNGYLAECVEKTTKIFYDLLGRKSLPKNIFYENYRGDIKAYYESVNNAIYFNKDCSSTMYGDKYTHREAMEEEESWLLPDWASSRHPAHVFAHEFSHCAHWHHLEERNGYSSAKRVWEGLVGTRIPSAIGRLIARYKISNYAVGTKSNCDMCEFLAERMAQDVCKGLHDESWRVLGGIDVDYDNIFSRKWDYRYSNVQSYLDYFTQQVWNGDIDGAKKVGDDVEAYLAEIDAQPVAQGFSRFELATKGTMFEAIGKAASRLGKTVTEKLNERNALPVHKS